MINEILIDLLSAHVDLTEALKRVPKWSLTSAGARP